MGYDIHISRKENWFDDQGPHITLAQWQDYLHGDPEMRLDGFAEAALPNESTLRITDPGMAVWIAHPGHGQDEGMAWLWLDNGTVAAKNPDDDTMQKMWRIAQAFDAKVQGEDGELYDASGAVISS